MDFKKEALAFALVTLIFIVSLNLLIGNIDLWGVYYYRNVQATLDNGTTSYVDELSYLGRNFTFPPVFFEFASEIALLIGAGSYESIRLPVHFSIVFIYALTTYMLFKNFKTRNERIVGALLFMTQTFVLITAASITLHIFAYAMLNIAVIFFERDERLLKALSIVALALAFATHPTSLFFFPFLAYAYRLFKLDSRFVKSVVIQLIIAVLISLIFYMPILLQNGLPYEIVPSEWGYMLTYGFSGVWFDFQFSFALIAVSIAYGFYKGYRLPSLALLLFALADAFITFRANMLVVIMLSFLFPKAFSPYLRDKKIFGILMLFFVANLAFIPVMYSGVTSWCTWGTANRICIAPMQYIRAYTSSGESVAVNPVYGHLAAYFGERPVLADLYVEYADKDKFEAENNFYNDLNTTGVEKYNITLLVLDDIRGERNLANHDRVYDNGFIQIYRK